MAALDVIDIGTGPTSSAPSRRRSSSAPRTSRVFDSLFELHFAVRGSRSPKPARAGERGRRWRPAARSTTSLDRPADAADARDDERRLDRAPRGAHRRPPAGRPRAPCASWPTMAVEQFGGIGSSPARPSATSSTGSCAPLELSRLMAQALRGRARGGRRRRHRRSRSSGPSSPSGSRPSSAMLAEQVRSHWPSCAGADEVGPDDGPAVDRRDRLPGRVAPPARRDARGDPAARPRARDARWPGGAGGATGAGSTSGAPSGARSRRAACRIDPVVPAAQGRPAGPVPAVRRVRLGRRVRLVHADPAPGDDERVLADALVRVRRRHRRGDRPPQGRRLVPRGAPRALPGRRRRATTATATTARSSSGSGTATGRDRLALHGDHHRRRPLERARHRRSRRSARCMPGRAGSTCSTPSRRPSGTRPTRSSTSTARTSTACSRSATSPSSPTRSCASA